MLWEVVRAVLLQVEVVESKVLGGDRKRVQLEEELVGVKEKQQELEHGFQIIDVLDDHFSISSQLFFLHWFHLLFVY